MKKVFDAILYSTLEATVCPVCACVCVCLDQAFRKISEWVYVIAPGSNKERHGKRNSKKKKKKNKEG